MEKSPKAEEETAIHCRGISKSVIRLAFVTKQNHETKKRQQQKVKKKKQATSEDMCATKQRKNKKETCTMYVKRRTLSYIAVDDGGKRRRCVKINNEAKNITHFAHYKQSYKKGILNYI